MTGIKFTRSSTSTKNLIWSLANFIPVIEHTFILFFYNQIIEHTGESREVALSKLVALAALAPEWARYTKIVRLWLIQRATALNLPLVNP
jgi:hypothetical protein